MIAYKDKCYCQRSNKIYCQENEVELCNNILCNRHCWEIPKGVNRICYADFSNFCIKFFHDLEPAECPFCDSYNTKTTYRIKCRTFTVKGGKELIDCVFRVSCKNCKSQIGEIRLNNIEKGDENTIKLGKLASIWKWNGYGKRQVNKEKREAELKQLQEIQEFEKTLKGYGINVY